MSQAVKNQKPAKAHVQLYFLLARSFWIAFNHVNMYGPGHPLGNNAIEECLRRLKDVLILMPYVTLHLERDGFYVERERVDRELRLDRLVDRMRQAGIESLTFIRGITIETITKFFSLLANSQDFRTLKEIRVELPEKQVFYNRLVQRAQERVFVAPGKEGPIAGATGTVSDRQSPTGRPAHVVPESAETKPGAGRPAGVVAASAGTADSVKQANFVVIPVEEQIPATQKIQKKLRLKNPPGMISARETRAIIETEIYRAARYEVPFSILLFSLEGKFPLGTSGPTPVVDVEIMEIMRALVFDLKSLLRHLDQVGTLANLRKNRFLVILPMTPLPGALMLMERLERKYADWPVKVGSQAIKPLLYFSTFTYDDKKTLDSDKFIKQAQRRHRQKIKIMREQKPILE